MDILILVGGFAALCTLGMPVAYALGLAAVLAALWIDIPLEAVMLKVSDGTDDSRCSRSRSSSWPAASWPRAGSPSAWSISPRYSSASSAAA